MTLARETERNVLKSAHALLGRDLAIAHCRGGGNSRVYRVESTAGTFALKLYPEDGRRRAQREFGATTFFAEAGLARVPRPVAIDGSRQAAAYSWVEGEPVGKITLQDVDLLAAFAGELHALGMTASGRRFGNAAEACFDEHSVLDQIQLRFDRLADIGDRPLLSKFLHVHFAPIFEAERSRIRTLAARRGRGGRTLSPSDFGFHNALRTSSMGIAFLDFEYFGWDDPVKLVSDVCWHPGMELRRELRQHFVARCIEVYRDDAAFEERLGTTFALYGLRWCLIVLNEFLPTFWERRVAAGLMLPACTVLSGQLDKAYAILERVVACLEGDSL